MRYLFNNCYMPFTDEHKSIYVKDGYIENILILPDDRPVDKIIDLQDRIVFNGFVDSHMHLDKALIGEKVFNKSGTLKEAIDIMTKYKKEMSKGDIKDRARRTLNLSYQKGTRYLRTHVDVDEIIGLKGLEAVLELKEEFKEKIQISVVAFPQEGFVENMENYKYLEKALIAGADIVGGIPATEEDSSKHIDMVFNLAKKYDKDIDMHIDETDDPDSLTLKYLAEKTIKENYQKRVVAGHCCSLAANSLEDIQDVLALVKKAEISIVTLPSTNLYLQGRDDLKNFRRGITRVKDLLREGINVCIGSDNIRDPFNPFGNGNLLEVGLITAHGCHMGGLDELDKLFQMISIIPATLFGNYEIQEGGKARFVVIDINKKNKAIIEQSKIYGCFEREEYYEFTN
jgi:cytosine/creatinine deaminase